MKNPLLMLLLLASNLSAQTGALSIVNGVINFGSAGHTATVKIVPSTGALPSSGCTAGELAVVTAATVGQQIYENSTTGSCTWTQQLDNTGGGGGIIGYSSPTSIALTGTQFFPVTGGGAPNSTETNVDIDSPNAATVLNFFVQLSGDPGSGNSVALTWRKNATDQSVTCTVTGSVGGNSKSCSDTTHSFSVSQGDLITVKAVTTGTILSSLNVMFATQFGTINSSGSVNTGAVNQTAYYAAAGTAISGAGPGSSGQVWTSNGAGSAPTFQAAVSSVAGLTGAVAGGWVLLEQHAASNSAELDFTTCISASYDDYIVRLINLVPATNAANLFVDVSTNGGATYDTTSGHYSGSFLFIDSAATGVSGTTSTSHYLVADAGSSTAANGGFSGQLDLMNPSLSGDKNMIGEILRFNSGNSFAGSQAKYGGAYTQTTAVNAFRLIMSAGNITSGTARCYGVAKQ